MRKKILAFTLSLYLPQFLLIIACTASAAFFRILRRHSLSRWWRSRHRGRLQEGNLSICSRHCRATFVDHWFVRRNWWSDARHCRIAECWLFDGRLRCTLNAMRSNYCCYVGWTCCHGWRSHLWLMPKNLTGRYWASYASC